MSFSCYVLGSYFLSCGSNGTIQIPVTIIGGFVLLRILLGEKKCGEELRVGMANGLVFLKEKREMGGGERPKSQVLGYEITRATNLLFVAIQFLGWGLGCLNMLKSPFWLNFQLRTILYSIQHFSSFQMIRYSRILYYPELLLHYYRWIITLFLVLQENQYMRFTFHMYMSVSSPSLQFDWVYISVYI